VCFEFKNSLDVSHDNFMFSAVFVCMLGVLLATHIFIML
jgi:hypothetical protein